MVTMFKLYVIVIFINFFLCSDFSDFAMHALVSDLPMAEAQRTLFCVQSPLQLADTIGD